MHAASRTLPADRYTVVWRETLDIPVLVHADGAVWPYDRLAKHYVPPHLGNLTPAEQERARSWAADEQLSSATADDYQPDLWQQRSRADR